MLYNAKNLSLELDGTQLDYARFGKGKKVLSIIPGLSLKDVRGAALPLAWMYRMFAKDYTVYVFDKKRHIPDGYTVRDIAEDIAAAMRSLGIKKSDVMGVSQGGMAAQYLALEHPELVNKLVLAVTTSKSNDKVHERVNEWIRLSEQGDFGKIVLGMTEWMYSPQYVKRYRMLLPLLAKVSRPKDPQRFIRLAKACLTCDTYDRLTELKCPVLVLGGSGDEIVTGSASEEIAEKLGCEIHMYPELGHAAYEEAKDFNDRVYTFLQK